VQSLAPDVDEPFLRGESNQQDYFMFSAHHVVKASPLQSTHQAQQTSQTALNAGPSAGAWGGRFIGQAELQPQGAVAIAPLGSVRMIYSHAVGSSHSQVIQQAYQLLQDPGACQLVLAQTFWYLCCCLLTCSG